MMKKQLAAMIMALIPFQANADGHDAYTSFVVKVPYDIQMPPVFDTAELACVLNTVGENPVGIEYTEIDVPLDAGRASGEVSFGFDRTGAISLDSQIVEPRLSTLIQTLAAGRFDMEARCFLAEFRSGSEVYQIDRVPYAAPGGGQGLRRVIVDDAKTPFATLREDTSVLQVTRAFNDAENEEFGAFDAGPLLDNDTSTLQSPAAGTAPSIPPGSGLQGLTDILTRP